MVACSSTSVTHLFAKDRPRQLRQMPCSFWKTGKFHPPSSHVSSLHLSLHSSQQELTHTLSAHIKNAIIGATQAEGIHCRGTCTIENVWWIDICEDAATFKQLSGTSYVIGGGARSASDKVFQFNGRGTVNISGFYAEDYGKLIRSCGDCEANGGPRNIVISGVTATKGSGSKGGPLCGINSNYGGKFALPLVLSSVFFVSPAYDGQSVTTLSCTTSSFALSLRYIKRYSAKIRVISELKSQEGAPQSFQLHMFSCNNTNFSSRYLPHLQLLPEGGQVLRYLSGSYGSRR